MSLSTCESCGGHIPLGPTASNRCESCGEHVFGSTAEAEARVAKIQAALGNGADEHLWPPGTDWADAAAAAIASVAELESDLESAAKDLPVPMPEPGTDMARLLSANVLLKRRVAGVERLIADDGFAISCQSLGQYRSALLEAIRG